MQNNGFSRDRRRFLTTAATIVGGAGAAMAATPFFLTMTPSARTKAVGAPVEVDISQLKPGERIIVKWQGKPVWILRRTQAMLNGLADVVGELIDPDSSEGHQPDYAANETRAIRPEYFVVIGLCTHLGCSPRYTTQEEGRHLGANWKGGFFCPCHGSRFDLAGRVVKGWPAPHNLVVPPHQYLGSGRLLIGSDREEVSA